MTKRNLGVPSVIFLRASEHSKKCHAHKGLSLALLLILTLTSIKVKAAE